MPRVTHGDDAKFDPLSADYFDRFGIMLDEAHDEFANLICGQDATKRSYIGMRISYPARQSEASTKPRRGSIWDIGLSVAAVRWADAG